MGPHLYDWKVALNWKSPGSGIGVRHGDHPRELLATASFSGDSASGLNGGGNLWGSLLALGNVGYSVPSAAIQDAGVAFTQSPRGDQSLRRWFGQAPPDHPGPVPAVRDASLLVGESAARGCDVRRAACRFEPINRLGCRWCRDAATLRACARLTGEGQPVEVRRKEGVTNHFRPESCAGRCEAAGEALTGVRTGRAIEHRKVACLERRDRVRGRRQHLHHRDGEGMEGTTVSENPRTFVRPSSGPGRSSFCPGSRTGAAEGKEALRNRWCTE